MLVSYLEFLHCSCKFYQETDWEDRLRNHLCRNARHMGHFVDDVTQLQSTVKTTLNKIFKYQQVKRQNFG